MTKTGIINMISIGNTHYPNWLCYNYPPMSKNENHEVHSLLSQLTDHEPNVYELTRDIARIAKQIKEDTKESSEPPKPTLEAIKVMYEARVPH